jgi:peptide/nickel transport system permease protein
LIGVGATLAAILFGSLVGGFAGYYRGMVDVVLMRVTEFFQTIPAFILAILIVAILSPSVPTEVLAIAAVSWPGIPRLVRGEFVALGGREFVLACTGLGASDARIILRHLLPNCTSSIVAVGSLLIGTAILIEASLAFLSLGDPNVLRPECHELGPDDQRRPSGAALCLVDLHLPRNRHPADRAEHQPDR